ncbi:MAG: hypothetical protein R2838_04115 [Caldilineaceae bacterium]
MATLFKRDPRCAPSRQSSGPAATSPYLTVFDTLAATLEDRHGIYPNIDSMAAAAVLDARDCAAFGTGLFLSSRGSHAIVHIQGRAEEQPSGGRSETLRRGCNNRKHAPRQRHRPHKDCNALAARRGPAR